MAVTFTIVGPNGNEVQVTPSGELVVAPLHYDETEFRELAVDDTAYNFKEPEPGRQFVITGFIAVGDQQIQANATATVVIYEAEDTGTLTVDKVLIQFVLTRAQAIPMAGMHVLVNAGKFINAKTDDDNVHLTLMGYSIEEL